MVRPKVFVSLKIFPEALARISQVAEMEVWPEEMPPPYEVLKEKVRDVEGLLSMLVDRIDAALMAAAPKLRVVSNLAVGYDNIDVAEATKRHIVIGNTPGVLSETTADLAFALLMAAARRVVEADNYTRKGLWRAFGPMVLLGQDVHRATLGIIGLGRIGAEVAKRARSFAMKVIYYSRKRRSEEEERRLGVEYVPDLATLFSRADFISVHVPLTPLTRHLIGAAEFALMKPTAVFINTSRGLVVDQKALYEVLKSHRIFAAGLDVTAVEPIPPDDPLLTLDNVVITPHIGSASFATRTRMALMAAENLIAGLQEKVPPHCVNPEALRD
jgi:glyoxylate reductase